MFNWFDATGAKDFGEKLASFFIQGMPDSKHFGDKAFEMKASKQLKLMATQIDEFKRANKLNAYKKAQLGNAFRWRLIDAGVPGDYADKLTKWLMLQFG